jgi:hypothetical protein
MWIEREHDIDVGYDDKEWQDYEREHSKLGNLVVGLIAPYTKRGMELRDADTYDRQLKFDNFQHCFFGLLNHMA